MSHGHTCRQAPPLVWSAAFRPWLATLLAAGAALAGQPATVPLAGGPRGTEGLGLVPRPGIEARAVPAPEPPGAVAVRFAKTGHARRLLALEARPPEVPEGLQALALDGRLELSEGASARPALLAFEADGGAWLCLRALPLEPGPFADVRLPLGSFRRAAFARDDDPQLRWDQVERLWLGLVLDGPAEGAMALTRAVLTSEPYRPERPLEVPWAAREAWSVAKDAAAHAALSTPREGPSGGACVRVDFRFPGGRHMYAVPSVQVPEADLAPFAALRFAYKATLPRGIEGLLVMLIERDGSQYYASPAPPASAEWTTATIPFERFRRGGWSPDENDRLDLHAVGSVAIGVHGTATEARAQGTVWAADVRFAPPGGSPSP